MPKLNIDHKTIKDLLIAKKSDFLIPDYQRPYAWTEDEYATLWDDLFTFAFPDNDYRRFDSEKDEYFLGPIVTFTNEQGKLEIIDGQQRLTTIMLLLRAFYSKFEHAQDRQTKSTRETISKYIWKTDEFGEPDTSKLKIDSEVASTKTKRNFFPSFGQVKCLLAKKVAMPRQSSFFTRGPGQKPQDTVSRSVQKPAISSKVNGLSRKSVQ